MRIVIVVALLAACGGGGGAGGQAGQPDTTPEPVGGVEQPPTDGRLTLGVQVLRRPQAGQAVVPLGKGETIHTGDAVEFVITPTRDAYIYVLQQFPNGTLGTLWPQGNAHVRYLGGRSVTIPEGELEIVVEPPEGDETLYVIASPKQLDQADSVLQVFVDEGRKEGGKVDDAIDAADRIELTAQAAVLPGTGGTPVQPTPPDATKPKPPKKKAKVKVKKQGAAGAGQPSVLETAGYGTGLNKGLAGRARAFKLRPKKAMRVEAEDDDDIIVLPFPLKHEP